MRSPDQHRERIDRFLAGLELSEIAKEVEAEIAKAKRDADAQP
jgi:hypothetical protein